MSESKPLRAAIYARSSLGTVAGQDPSLQVLQLKQYAEQRGIVVVDEYVDVCSGAKDRRSALDRLMKDARRHRFNVLLLTALDRAFRSTKHMIEMAEELDQHGIKLISLREQMDFTTAWGKLALTILSALATLERDVLRDRVKTGMAMRRLAAEKAGLPYHQGRPPVPDHLVHEVIRLRGDRGLSLREIERALSKQVSRSSIARIIKEAGVSQGSRAEGVPTLSTSPDSQDGSGS